jgi:hypothetical protein
MPLRKCITALILVIAGAVCALTAQSALGQSVPAVKLSTNTAPRLGQTELVRRWQALQLEVGHADVVWPHYFTSSLNYWQSGELDSNDKWSIDQGGDFLSLQTFSKESSVLIKGNCCANLALLKGGLVHIYGNLTKTIDMRDYGEIVIGGDVTPGAGIESDKGIVSVFIGGDLQGVIRSKGTLHIAIGGSLKGTMWTGNPSTDVHVRGNLNGQLKPTSTGGLLLLDVDGYMKYAAIESLSREKYVEIRANIAVSNHAPGIYPRRADEHSLGHHRCWTIHAQR